MIQESSISFQAGKSNDDEKSDNNNTNQSDTNNKLTIDQQFY
jgi:hypothetical protein